MLQFMQSRLLSSLVILLISSGGILAQAEFPSVLKHVAPGYPAAARAVGAGGTVQLVAEVDSTGKVVSVKSFSGHPLLRRMAEITVEKWAFSAVPGNHFLTISIGFIPGDDNEDLVTIRGPYNLTLRGQRPRIMSK